MLLLQFQPVLKQELEQLLKQSRNVFVSAWPASVSFLGDWDCFLSLIVPKSAGQNAINSRPKFVNFLPSNYNSFLL